MSETEARILFVDDEPDILAGIRNNLRKERKRWHMDFAVGADEAIPLLEASSFDVVISDMRMPGMDGATLLNRTRELRPEAIRIVLSGHADDSSTMRAAAIAQQWLAKPCDRSTLVGTIQRALVARDLVADASDRMRICGIASLPSPPEIVEEIRRLVADPECSIEALAEIIIRDPAVSAKILQLTNSAFFSLPCEVTNIAEAIPRLGLDTVSALAVRDAAFRALDFGDQLEPGQLERIQSRSYRCATLAAALARAIDPETKDASASFTGGLLHSIGLLVVSGTEVDDNEHPRFGAGFLAAWGLPLRIVDAVARHIDLGAIDGEPPLSSRCVHTAHHFLTQLASGEDLAEILRDQKLFSALADLTEVSTLRDAVEQFCGREESAESSQGRTFE